MKDTVADLINGTGDRSTELRMRALRQQRLEKIPTSVTLSRQDAAPPPTAIFTEATAGMDTISFVFVVVDSPLVYGYRIYSSADNNPDAAQRIGFISQPSDKIGQLKYQDIVGQLESRYYWVASINPQGVESPRVAMQMGTSPTTTGGGGAPGPAGPAGTPGSSISTILSHKIRFADDFAGANAGAQILAAINDGPSTGVTVSAIALEGAQTISTNIFSGITKPVTLMLGSSTITLNANMTVPTNVVMVFGPASVILVSATRTLTFEDDASIQAGSWQIFSGTAGKATATMTVAGNAVDGNTVRVGYQIYTMRTVPSLTYDVAIGVDSITSLNNLGTAMNTGAAANAAVVPTGNTPTTLSVRARYGGRGGNVVTQATTWGTWSALTGGVAPVVFLSSTIHDRPIVDAKWFGATGDGVTDDLAALELARESLEQHESPVEATEDGIAITDGVVSLPSGIYAISDELLVAPFQTWRGLEAEGATQIVFMSGVAPTTETFVIRTSRKIVSGTPDAPGANFTHAIHLEWMTISGSWDGALDNDCSSGIYWAAAQNSGMSNIVMGAVGKRGIVYDILNNGTDAESVWIAGPVGEGPGLTISGTGNTFGQMNIEHVNINSTYTDSDGDFTPAVLITSGYTNTIQNIGSTEDSALALKVKGAVNIFIGSVFASKFTTPPGDTAVIITGDSDNISIASVQSLNFINLLTDDSVSAGKTRSVRMPGNPTGQQRSFYFQDIRGWDVQARGNLLSDATAYFGTGIQAPIFTFGGAGPGLDDLTISGAYFAEAFGNAVRLLEVEIDATGAPDTYKWRINGGAYTTGVAITALPVDTVAGAPATFTFGATTGHTLGDKWAIYARRANITTGSVPTLDLRGYRPSGVTGGQLFLFSLGGGDGDSDPRAFLQSTDADGTSNPHEYLRCSPNPAVSGYRVQIDPAGTEGAIFGGIVRMNNLAGSGSRFVKADANGLLSAAALTSLDIPGVIRATSAAFVAPAAGAGLEMNYRSGTDDAWITAYNRTTAVYKNLYVQGFTVTLSANGTDALVASGSGVNIALGGLSVAGNVIVTSGLVLQSVTANASIITSGTLALARGGTATDNSSVAQNRAWMSPDGAPGAASYRALVAADIPALSYVPSGGGMAGTINLAKLTGGGANGTITVDANGIITAFVNPT